MYLPLRAKEENFHALLGSARNDILAIEMHNTLQIKAVSTESNATVSSLWTLHRFLRLLCIFITVFEAHLQQEDTLTLNHNLFLNRSWLPNLVDLAPIYHPPTYPSDPRN